MMRYYHIPAAFFTALIVILLISLFTKRPLRALWIFFLILFLATWMGQLWITPFGPAFWGVPWLPLFTIPLFISFLIFAITPVPPKTKAGDSSSGEEAPLIALGFFFWLLIMLMVVGIIAGYFRWTYST